MRLFISILVLLFFIPGTISAQPLVYSKKQISIISQAEPADSPEEKTELAVTKFSVDLRSENFLYSDLIFSNPFPKNHGMLVVLAEEQIMFVPMSNIYTARDLLFIDSHNKISEIIPSASSQTSIEIKSTDSAKALLQLNGGVTTSYDIKVGDTINY